MSSLEGFLCRLLDDHEVTPTGVVLVKDPGG